MAQVLRWLALAAFALVVVLPAVAQRQPSRSPHGPLTIPCENCHTSTSWTPIRAIPEFNHDTTRYPLRGMHEKVSCTGCHMKPVFTDVGKNCADCHADIHRAQFGNNCAKCHTVLGWQSSVQAIEQHFNRFPLLGAHAVVQCEQCHKNAAVGNYLGLSTACESCHLQDWQGTTNPAHARAGTAFAASNCSTCHAFDTWLNAKFDHSSTGFPLTQGHANVACAQCHVSNNYNLTTTLNQCGNSGCHLTTWQTTTNPVHPSAGPAFALANCSGCHTPADWTTATFDHSTTGFLLTNGHANLACTSCHVNNNYTLQIAPNACGTSGCHLTTWQTTTNPVHSASGPSFALTNCSSCHTTVSWTTAVFDHSTTGFLLTQGHANVACAACHINNNYSLTIAPTDCGNSQCHLTDWNGTNNPVHKTSGPTFAATNCSTCHTPAGWDAASFDHSVTGFTLTGTHMSPTPTPCASCHVSNNYGLTSADCYGCHQAAYQSTTTLGGAVPNHIAAGFPTTAAQCASCHPITTWAAGIFNHSGFGFDLTNGHANVACALCHIGGNYALQIAATNCGNSQCHLTDWTGTNNPTHASAGAPFAAANCSTCHTTVSWTTATFDHSTTTFPLTGAHTTVACALCHVGNNYSGTLPTTCYNCHIPEWNSTQTLGGSVPNHITAGFPQDCTQCHTTANWTSATFNHNNTTFPLTGAHTTVACALCHVGNNYSGTLPTTCYNCHIAEWNSTQTLGGAVPNHIAAAFPQDCTLCHTTTNWTSSTFNHNTTTFPLTGAHVTVACALCHVGGNYSGTLPTTCYNCHIADWNSTTTLGGAVPNHIAAGFPQDCTQCHTTANWSTSTFNHNTTTFPLTGAHTTVACALCHVGGNYSGTLPTTCYNCHTADWQSTTTLGGAVPNHITAGFPQDCTVCHSTTNWTTSTFNHATTTFPLTGAHTTVACALCHVNGNYSGTLPTDCYGCHTADYQSTATLGGAVPNHITSGYPTTCASCHTTTSWLGAVFDHSTTGFPLTGAHTTVACNLCHTSSAVPPTDCYSCHTADWNSTANLGGAVPNHTAADASVIGIIPASCSTCHTTTNWLGATFTHSYFPVNHGNAGGICANCHTNPSTTYTAFQCTGCHGNNNAANFNHPKVGGYVYNSVNCYACHKSGGGG